MCIRIKCVCDDGGGGGEGHFIAHDYGVIDFKSVGIQRCGHLVTNASV